MNKILVSGSLAYDHIMDFPDLFRNHFMPDKLHNINVSFQVQQHNEHFGGTAGNIAYNLALLEEDPHIIATAGRDFASYEEHLKKNNISLDTIHHNSELPTSFAYILTDRGDNQIAAFYMGAGGKAYRADVSTVGTALGIIAPGCIEDMNHMPKVFREGKVPFFFDPGQAITALSESALKNGLEGAEVVFGNDYEFGMICQKTAWQEPDMLRHARTLVITLGELGSRIVTRSAEVKVPAVRAVKVVDPTGAGDAYRAGYIKGHLAGLSPEKCAKIASTVAVFCVEKEGTQEHHFTMQDIKDRYEDGYKEEFPL